MYARLCWYNLSLRAYHQHHRNCGENAPKFMDLWLPLPPNSIYETLTKPVLPVLLLYGFHCHWITYVIKTRHIQLGEKIQSFFGGWRNSCGNHLKCKRIFGHHLHNNAMLCKHIPAQFIMFTKQIRQIYDFCLFKCNGKQFWFHCDCIESLCK